MCGHQLALNTRLQSVLEGETQNSIVRCMYSKRPKRAHKISATTVLTVVVALVLCCQGACWAWPPLENGCRNRSTINNFSSLIAFLIPLLVDWRLVLFCVLRLLPSEPNRFVVRLTGEAGCVSATDWRARTGEQQKRAASAVARLPLLRAAGPFSEEGDFSYKISIYTRLPSYNNTVEVVP